MITYREIQAPKRVFERIECDRCGKICEEGDQLEIQEFHQIHFQGGYASVFGDETNISCDLCQNCLKELIGKFCYYDGIKQKEEKR